MAFDVDELIAEYERARRELWEQKALQEEREQGLRQGEALLFRRLLERKFGTLSSATEERIEAAAPDQIEQWSMRILEAKTLAEVFA